MCLVLSVGEQGYLEGRCKDIEGWFPSNHVQDICVFSKRLIKEREMFDDDDCLENGRMSNDDTIVISRDALSALMINNDAYIPRTIVLQKGKKGFGFVLRGSRSNNDSILIYFFESLVDVSVAGKLFQPSPSFPALQFLDIIEKGSNAEKAGLKQNDYVLQVKNLSKSKRMF